MISNQCGLFGVLRAPPLGERVVSNEVRARERLLPFLEEEIVYYQNITELLQDTNKQKDLIGGALNKRLFLSCTPTKH